jgi:hypothetical protein
LSDSFPIQNGLNQGDALSPLLLNLALKYAIRKVQENQFGLKLNDTHQLLSFVNDVNEASKEVGLEINVEKTENMLLSRHHNAGQDQDIKIANK